MRHGYAAALALTFGTVGCTPNNAHVTQGTYTGLLAAGTSPTLFEDLIDFDQADDAWVVDCRDEDDGRLDGAIDICDDPLWEPEHEGWLTNDGFRVIQEPLEPWRGEAVVTSEGDLQLTFHQRLPGGEDFRFAMVVDPDFQPTKCVEQENGGVRSEPLDGDWLDEWSADAQGRMFYLNAGAYQFNPSNTEDIWALPQEWRAGFASAKFASENMLLRPVRYGLPSAYSVFELEQADFPSSGELFYAPNNVDGLAAAVQTVSEEVEAELDLIGVPADVRVHDNAWRPIDERAQGLDGWVELHYNWVRFDPGSELEIGGAASGEFFLTFDGEESQTRAFVSGRFEVDRFKRDHWVTDDIEAIKLEESGQSLCVDN